MKLALTLLMMTLLSPSAHAKFEDTLGGRRGGGTTEDMRNRFQNCLLDHSKQFSMMDTIQICAPLGKQLSASGDDHFLKFENCMDLHSKQFNTVGALSVCGELLDQAVGVEEELDPVDAQSVL